jgi:uncharacterized FAD-dependent dehydrogenase
MSWTYQIERRSLDARRKPDLRFIYHLARPGARGLPGARRPGRPGPHHRPDRDQSLYNLPPERDPLPLHPIVVGAGPAGQMAAYLLALHGCKPLVIDRGRDADRRTGDLATFHASRRLDPESNYLFGEGGAGTYSDGKLYTRVKDRRMRFLLEAFVAARAPRHILYRHHPHIGSDLLPHMCKRLRSQIVSWGGSFRWDATVTDVLTTRAAAPACELTNGERIEAPLVLIAPGHSARDLIMRLIERGIEHKAKGFQIGCRVEHPQDLIDVGQYGCRLGPTSRATSWAPPNTTWSAGRRRTSAPTMSPPSACARAARSSPRPATRAAVDQRHEPLRARLAFANAGLIVNQEVDRGRLRAGGLRADQARWSARPSPPAEPITAARRSRRAPSCAARPAPR